MQHNLLVALFDPSAALLDLCNALFNAAVREEETSTEGGDPEHIFPRMRALAQKVPGQRQEQRWITHVKLRRLSGRWVRDTERLGA